MGSLSCSGLFWTVAVRCGLAQFRPGALLEWPAIACHHKPGLEALGSGAACTCSDSNELACAYLVELVLDAPLRWGYNTMSARARIRLPGLPCHATSFHCCLLVQVGPPPSMTASAGMIIQYELIYNVRIR